MSSKPFSQFEKSYRVTSNSTLDHHLWNGVFRNIDTRLLGIEEKKASFEEAEQQILEIGLRRINEVFNPAAQKFVALSEFGFLTASSEESLLPIDGEPLSVYLIKDVKADLFTPSPFVALVRRSTPDAYAIGHLLAYDRNNAHLVLHIDSVQGVVEACDDWDVAALAGSVKAMWDALQESRSIRDEVIENHSEIETKAEAVEQKHGAVQASHADFVSTWYGALETPPDEAKVGAMYLDISQSPAIVKVKAQTDWIIAAISAENLYTKEEVYNKAEADNKFLTQDNAQFLPLSGGNVIGDITRTGSQRGSYGFSIPDGNADGGGLKIVPQSGGLRTELNYLAGGGFYIRINNSNLIRFLPNGVIQLNAIVVSNGFSIKRTANDSNIAIFSNAGNLSLINQSNTAIYYSTGNIKGSIWAPWGSDFAFNAISARIEDRAAAVADAKINAFKNNPQFTGTLKVTGSIKATGNIQAYTS